MARLGLVLVAFVALTLPVMLPNAAPAVSMLYALAPDGALSVVGESPLRADATFVSNGAEPHILVDKLGRSILIGDWSGVYMSLDGGASWFENTPPYANSPLLSDGWVFAQDNAGTIYASTTNGQMINVASSTNGGISWQLNTQTFVTEPHALADRPWLAVKDGGVIALIWNDGQNERCSYSTNGGLTWTRALPYTTGSGRPIAGEPAWDRTGKLVYVGGTDERTLFRYPTFPCTGALSQIALPAIGKEMQLNVGTDAAGGIYVGAPSGDNKQMTLIGYNGFNASTMKRITVSPPALQNNMFATVSVRNDNEIAVAWYGTTKTGDPTASNFNGHWNVSVARVQNFWSASPTITYQQVTTQPNHVGGFCVDGVFCSGGADRDLLDYWATAYDTAGNLHLSYGADGATSQARVYYTKLAAIA